MVELRCHPLPRSEATFQRRRRGSEQQSQGGDEKILRVRHLPCLELALYHPLGKLPSRNRAM